MKKVLFGTLVFIAANCFAQDPRFRQFYSSGLNANPAFAGAYEYPEVSLMYRNEWPSLNVNHNSYFLSYNQYMNKLKGGLGLYYMHETEEDGVYNTNSFHLDYSPSFSLDSNWVLKPAF